MPDKKTQTYKTEDEIKQEARLRREQEAADAATKKPESKRKTKFDNYWYHYKWHTIAGVVALLLVCLFISDTFLREKPDATIVMVSDRYFAPDETDAIRKNLEQIAWDRNGDGRVYILIDSNHLAPDIDSPNESDYAAQMKLVAVVAAGAEPLYLIDEAAYDRLMQMSGQTEDSPDIEVFVPESVPADKFGAADMTLYMRYGKDDDAYYQYCMELLQAFGR